MINWVKSFGYNALTLILYIIVTIYLVSAINSAAKLLFIDYAYSDRLYMYHDNQIFIESLDAQHKAEINLLTKEQITAKRLEALEHTKLFIKSQSFASIFNYILYIALSGILIFVMRRFNKNITTNDHQ